MHEGLKGICYVVSNNIIFAIFHLTIYECDHDVKILVKFLCLIWHRPPGKSVLCFSKYPLSLVTPASTEQDRPGRTTGFPPVCPGAVRAHHAEVRHFRFFREPGRGVDLSLLCECFLLPYGGQVPEALRPPPHTVNHRFPFPHCPRARGHLSYTCVGVGALELGHLWIFSSGLLNY